jgi:hypothetical protein
MGSRPKPISHPQYDAKRNEGSDNSADPPQQHRVADGVQQHGEKNDERPKTGRKEIGGCHIESLKGLTKKSLKATVQIAA